VVETLTESVLEKMEKMDRKLDALKEFLEDVFITPEESELAKEADKAVRLKKFDELVPLDGV
jgi:hypothetical protein